MIEFDRDTHTYRFEGVVRRSVTQILEEWLLVNGYYVNTYNPKVIIGESVMKAARDHGTAVHDGVNIILTGTLDWDALHPSLVPPLRGFVEWFEAYKPSLVSTGYPMFSKKYNYCGTPDPFYVIKIGRREILCFVEIKTGEHLLVGPQLSAYIQMYREHSKFRGEIQRWVLELPKDGSYAFHQCKGRQDWAFFESCLFRKSFVDRLQNEL